MSSLYHIFRGKGIKIYSRKCDIIVENANKISLHCNQTARIAEWLLMKSPRLNGRHVSMAWEILECIIAETRADDGTSNDAGVISYRREWLGVLSILFAGWRAPIDPSNSAARVSIICQLSRRQHETRQLHRWMQHAKSDFVGICFRCPLHLHEKSVRIINTIGRFIGDFIGAFW